MKKKHLLLVALLFASAIVVAAVQSFYQFSGVESIKAPVTEMEQVEFETASVANKTAKKASSYQMVSLQNVPFCQWDGWGADANAIGDGYASWVVGEPTGVPYGDPTVINYADLSKYSKLVVVVSEGSPRFLFNRDIDDGVWNENEAESHMIDNTKGGWSSKYFSNEGNVYTVNLTAMVADKGYAHLHAIKGADWANVTVESMVLYRESSESITIYVQAALAPYLYVWYYDDEADDYINLNGEWPGTKMTEQVEVKGITFWKMTITKASESFNIIFSNSDGYQTEDINGITSDSYFYYDGYTEYTDLTSRMETEEIIDELAFALVSRSDVELSFTNDKQYPWTIQGTEVKNGNCGIKYSTSTLTMNYASTYKTELTFDWRSYNYSSHTALRLFVDGVQMSSTTNSSYNTVRLYLDPGQHVVVFKDSIGNSTSTSNYSYIKNLKVKEIAPLESAVLSAKSKPLTFVNEGTWPWTIEDGYIQNSNYGTAYSTSKFSTTFTVDKLSKFSFNRRVGYWNGSSITNSNYSYHYFRFRINGEQYTGCNYATSFGNISVALEPGTYTMEWQDTIYSSTSTFYSQISNIELSDNWVEVDLSSAGTLGVEVLYLVNVLTDVELLKVKGPINSTDWATIKQMTNLLAIDLSEATITSVPNSGFDGLSKLSYVKLPEGPTSIGSYAFRGTQILNIDIPNSVTSIGEGCFYQTRVRSVNFGEDSKLSTIGYRAFYQCSSLKEFIMPNTVTKLGTYNNYTDRECYTFYECTSLNKLHFSDALNTLEQYVCDGCTNLKEVHLPQNLNSIRDYAFYNTNSLRKIDFPNTLDRIEYEAFYNSGIDSLYLPLKLSTLDSYAFQDCKNLKYIELPSYIGSYDRNFYGCSSVQTVVSQSATPPSISNDPFQNARAKSAITLKVPSFAVVNYKLDSYWYQFGSIVEGDDIDYWKITSPLSLTNNRRMQGKPDIDLYYGGQFTVGGNAPMEVGLLNVFVSEDNPGRLLNTCEAMTADTINSYFSVSSEKWYFITPLHDVDLTKVTVSNNASFVFRYYDGDNRATNGTGNSWRNVDNGMLTAGQGYIFRCNADAVITFPAVASVHTQVFNTNDVIKQLSVHEAAASANKNWNFVGNPYPCFYDIYYMDFTAPITLWTGSTYKAYSIVDDDYALRPMQAFFVQKPSEVDNIVFHKEGRQLTPWVEHVSAARSFRAPANANRHFFELQMLGEEMIDETRIVVNENASLDYEISCDASKFMSFETAVPQMFTLDNNGNGYAINERPLADGTVRLAYYAGQSGFYTISAIRSDGDIYLYDAQTNKTVNLSEQDYTFHSDVTNGTNATRFVLSLTVNDGGEVTGIDSLTPNPSPKGKESIYTLSGQRVSSTGKGVYVKEGRKVLK